MKRLIWTGCFSYLLIGFAHVAAGSVLILMLKHYNLGYDQGGLLVFTQFAGLMVGVLSAPWWSQLMGRRGALIFALICLACAETIFSLLPPWFVILSIAPIAGFGFGMIETVVSALVIEGSPVDEKAKAFSRVEVFFGLGAFLMPLMSILFIMIGWWTLSFVLVAGLSVIMLVIWITVPFVGEAELLLNKKTQGSEAVSVASAPLRFKGQSLILLFMFITIFMIYVGVEMSLANFLPSMMVESLKSDEATALLSVTLLWLSMSIGRIYAGRLAERLKYVPYLLSHTGLAILLLVGMLYTNKEWILFLLVILLGLALSGLFSIALVYADRLLPGRTEKMTSFLIASGGIGGALLPLFTGWSLKNHSVFTTMLVLLGMIIIMLFLIYLTARMGKRRDNAPIQMDSHLGL